MFPQMQQPVDLEVPVDPELSLDPDEVPVDSEVPVDLEVRYTCTCTSVIACTCSNDGVYNSFVLVILFNTKHNIILDLDSRFILGAIFIPLWKIL